MKAVYITIHFGYNFGSVFQTIATKRIIEDAGVDAECVNYLQPRYTESRYWSDGCTSLFRVIRRILYYPIHLYSKHKYSRFLAQNCTLSKPIYDKDDFEKICPKADFYITGSDQVWNYYHNEGVNKHYFFDGIVGKKIAFASSIGMTDLPADYVEYMKQMLRTYSAISVREASAVKLLSDWGIKSIQLVDPTLVLNEEDWKQYASKRLVKEPYLFVYIPYNVSDKEIVYTSVRKIADANNLKVVTYAWDCRKDSMADNTIIFADPGDILSLFFHADRIVTNSFHGTAFSINLNKQFWVYMPSHFSTRLLSIIELCGLKDRMLEGVIGDNDINTIIDFTEANRVLEAEREKARKFIKEALL